MQRLVLQLLLWSLADASDCDGMDVSLLQTQLRLDTSRSLEPVGRSFFSEDPQQSAEFWIRYTTAERMSFEEIQVAGLQQSSESAAVLVKKLDGTPLEKLYFLKVPNWKLLGGLEHFVFFHILGMPSSQLTFIFFRRVGLNHQPG